MFLFNNCVGRNYVSIYGISDAFYDLGMTGFQANKATSFRPGEMCVVATRLDDGQIRFTRYRLARVEIKPDEDGTLEQVFCGPALQAETLSKADAARDGRYAIFFNKNGHFKQQSVLEQ